MNSPGTKLLLPGLLAALTACTQPASPTASSPGGPGAPASAEPPTIAQVAGLRQIVIKHPSDRWEREGFAEMAPSVRVSIGTGGVSETRVFLRVPGGGRIGAWSVPGQGRPTLKFPPGTESDRVSYVLEDGGRTRLIDDVRGTRWDSLGTEYFHVYLPFDDRPGSALIGVEWRRDDPEQERRATDWLVEWGRTHRAPPGGDVMDRPRADRFRRLNRCQSCHVSDKPAATAASERLPPWPTDNSGLYTPIAVFLPSAALSNTATFDDPNVGDPFMTNRCPKGTPSLRGHAGARWFWCDEGVPMGERDIGAAMSAGDPYAGRTCSSRRYLLGHMEGAAQALFAPMMLPCGPAR